MDNKKPLVIVTNINTFGGLNLEHPLDIEKKINQTVLAKFMYNSGEDKDPFYVKALVARENFFTVDFPEAVGPVRDLCAGASIIFKRGIKFKVLNGKFWEFAFLVEPNKKFGKGSKAYKVLYKVEEHFEIDVMADSEEEAIKTANEQDMCCWNHHEPATGKKVRPITSFVVWDNFKVTEINE
jgi:hypothetical protein